MALCLSACGNKGNTGEAKADTEAGSTEAEGDSTKAEGDDSGDKQSSDDTSSTDSDNESQRKENGDFLCADLTNVHIEASDEATGRYAIASVDYTKVSLEDEYAREYPLLAKKLEDIGKKDDANYDESLKNMAEDYLKNENYVDEENYTQYYFSSSSKILRADKTIFSIIKAEDSYQGGVHGYYTVYGEAYDTETGGNINLSDVVRDVGEFNARVKEKLLDKYPQDTFLHDVDEYFKDRDIEAYSWSIDYNGVTIYFQPYDLASFADGILTARFSFAEDGKYLNDKYSKTPDSYVMPVSARTDTYADVNGDGKEERILLVGTTEDPEWGAYEWQWEIENESIKSEVLSFENDSYLVCRNGKYYAYMFNKVENDYEIISIIDIATGKEIGGEYGLSNYGLYRYDFDDIEKEGIYGFWDKESAFSSPELVRLESRMDMLGTYSAFRDYYIADDGMPKSYDEFYFTDRMGFMIKPVRDIPCSIVDKDGKILAEDAVLPKDTLLRIVRTDGEDIIDLQAGDYAISNEIESSEEYPYYYTEERLDLNHGTFYRLKLETKGYEKTLDGEDVFDIFKGMMYAG